jgi:feruloyl-CoA synthase
MTAAKLLAFFQSLIDRLSAQGTGMANRVARATLLADPLSAAHGELTDKGSINQRAVNARRVDLVNALYNDQVQPIFKRSAKGT